MVLNATLLLRSKFQAFTNFFFLMSDDYLSCLLSALLASQELIGALLGCSFFCLFPVSNRGPRDLPTINFDRLFAYVTFPIHFNYFT